MMLIRKKRGWERPESAATPEVPHPRWSQASERVLGTDERVPTQLFNGYGVFVADRYRGLSGERLYA